jgi:biopolymer transport protein ExbD
VPIVIPSPRAKKNARSEIVPLIDIIFFLLATFVMVILSMVKNKGVPVNLPTATTAQPQERKDFASITLTERGEIYFNKEVVTPAALELHLKDLLAQNPDAKVFINGDAKAEFGKAVEALDTVRRLGITKIAIETKNQKPAAGATETTAPRAATPAPSAVPSAKPAADGAGASPPPR